LPDQFTAPKLPHPMTCNRTLYFRVDHLGFAQHRVDYKFCQTLERRIDWPGRQTPVYENTVYQERPRCYVWGVMFAWNVIHKLHPACQQGASQKNVRT
jgi:hypothetical protein